MKKHFWSRFYGRGKIFDVWSVPHFFFGVMAASFLGVFPVHFWYLFFGIILVAFAWECFELWVGIHETLLNRVMDGLLPLLGFFLLYHIFQNIPLVHGHRSGIFVVSIFTFLLLNYISWEARFNGEHEFLG
ncbi:MAG: hypothetical protein KBC83_00755 [Candidatus Moranbacteria bacterium]|jgi:hypothetical protein|nr:hypothetical protein [Candidatus Moranbacteria bacterium]MBP9801187.1 hypothetical protein [Candidatus Moranbacteria bacterium]